MATDPRSALPKRFRPFFDQSMTQAELRYGAQEDALGSVLAQLVRDYGRQSQAQHSAGQSVLGALSGAGQNLDKIYSDAGLTPALRGQIAGSPTGQRLAGELASGQADIQSQTLGAQQGQQYIQGKLYDDYQEGVGQVSDQSVSMSKERGLYTSSLLDQLISGDRANRSAVNAEARKQAAADQQAALDRGTSTANALIPQGFMPTVNDDGSVTLGPVLPGGKADPNPPGNKPKRTTGPGTATRDAQLSAGNDFKKALALAAGMTKGKGSDPKIIQQTQKTLTDGKPSTKGKVIYEEVPAVDNYGKEIPGKTVRRPKLDPETGEQMTSTSRPAIPSFDNVIAAAAAEQAVLGYVKTETVRALQKLGYSVNQIPGLKTQNQARKSDPLPRDDRDYARPGMAPSRDQQPG